MLRVERRIGKKQIAIGIAILLTIFCIGACIVHFYQSRSTEYEHYELPELSSEVYSIEEGYISGILPETTLRDLKNNLNEAEIVVYDKDNNKVAYTEYIGTGMKLVYAEKEYKLAVLGDVTGDGKIGITDLVQMKLASVGLRKSFTEEYLKAADINKSETLTITDVTKINLAVVNLIDMKAPVSFVPEVATTTTTITVTGETTDSNSGMKEYWFELNDNGWVKNDNAKENTYIFEGLTNGTEYSVRMKVVDNAGNTKITKKVKVRTRITENADIDISLSTEEWTNNNVMVSVYYNSNIANERKEISKDNGLNWEEYIGPITVEQNMTIRARVVNEDGEVLEEQEKAITNIDKLIPNEFNITTEVNQNSITVKAKTTDAKKSEEYGESGIKAYIFQINNNEWGKSEEVEVTDAQVETTHTFENLEQGTEYEITVIAVDFAGNERKAKNSSGDEGSELIKTPTIDEIIGNVGEITIVPNTTNWTKDGVTVTVTYPETEGYEKEIKIGNADWKTYTGAETVTSNTTVKARIKDSAGQSGKEKTLEIRNIDKLAPNDFEITVREVTPSKITISVNTYDAEATNESGKSGMAGYSFKIGNEEWTQTQETGIYTFTVEAGQSYTINAKAIDLAGNETEATNSDGNKGAGEEINVPTIDDYIEEEGLGEIKLKPSTTNWTNKPITIEAIYPNISGFIREISIDNGVNWSEYTESVEVQNNTIVKARLKDSENEAQTGAEKTLSIENIDKIEPTATINSVNATQNSITVTVTGSDEESGIAGYRYILKNGLWKWEEKVSETSYTFTNLSQGKTYSIEVIAVDNAENEGKATPANDSVKTDITTLITGDITISASNSTTWTKDNITVTVQYPENTEDLTKLISVDGGANWREYITNSTSLTIKENTTVLAKMMDGENQVGATATYDVWNIDKTAPEIENIVVTATARAIEITVIANDGETSKVSGIEGYYFNKDSEDWKYNTNRLQTKYKYEGLTPGQTYNIQIKVKDNAGNEKIETRQVTTKAEYTLTINPAGGTYTGETTIIGENGETATILGATKTGYTFSDWNLTGAGTLTGTTYTFGEGNATLTAQWNVNQYKITLNANNGTIDGENSKEIKRNYGDTISLTDTPIRRYMVTYDANGGEVTPTNEYVSYTFDGWYTEATGGTQVTNITMPAYNKTLYAHWTEGRITLPEPTREGYIFKGWHTNSSLTNKITTSTYTTSQNITLYADWEEEADIYATFYTDGTFAFTSTNRTLPGKTIQGEPYKIMDGDVYSKVTEIPWYDIKEDVKYVDIADSISPTSTAYWFAYFQNLTTIEHIENLNTRNVTNMKGMFDYCTSLTSIDVSRFNTEKVTDMSYMFAMCNKLTSLNLNNFNTEKVTDMCYMFNNCESLTSLNISSFKTDNVTDMHDMFYNCQGLTSLNLSHFNTTQVCNMRYMFANCNKLTSLNISNFNTSKVTDMRQMFEQDEKLIQLDLRSFNTSKVTDMLCMFRNCYEMTKILVGTGWSTSGTDTTNMFAGCGVSSVTRS